jgi:hypothetical protein
LEAKGSLFATQQVGPAHKRTHAQQQNAAYSITSPAVASSVGETAIRTRIYLSVTMDLHNCWYDNATTMLAET